MRVNPAVRLGLIFAMGSSFTVHAADEESELSLQDMLNVTFETASKQKQSITDAPSIVSVMSRRDIEKLGASSLVQALKFVPGVEVSMGVDGSWRVSIRGVRKDGNLLLLINGLAANDFYDGRAIFDLPTAFIEKVEIVRGTGSPLFGSNAIAGIINVFTVKGKNYAQVGLGTHQTIQVDGGHATAVSGGELSVMGGYHSTDGANVDPYSKLEAPLKDSKDTNRWVKDIYLNSQYNREQFQASLWAQKRNRGPWVGPRYIVADESELAESSYRLDASYALEPSESIRILPRVYVSYNIRDFDSQELPAGYTSSSSQVFVDGAWAKEDYTGTVLGSETQLTFKVNDNFSILAGLVLEKLTLNNYKLERNFEVGESPIYKGEFGNWDNVDFKQDGRTRTISGVFNENTITIEKLSFSAGFRYDNYSDFGSAFNPRSAVIYKPLEMMVLKAIFGQTFRAPTFKELYDQTDSSAFGTLGNEDLNPEIAQSSELSMELNFQSFIAKGNVYFNTTKDLIAAYDPQGTGGPGQYQNTGTLKNRGFEIEANTVLTKNIGMSANFSQFTMEFDWNSDKATESDLNYIKTRGDKYVTNQPARRVNAGLDLNVWKLRNFVGFSYGGRSEANRRSAIEGQRDTKIPSYLQGNFSIAYDHSSAMTIRLSGDNIGSRKHSDPDEGANIFKMGERGMVQPGAQYLLTTHYEF
jgi:outer membrane receptor for ferrienterochelin and colicins